MWAKEVPELWIADVINHCMAFNNRYLFQSKNPSRFKDWTFPTDTILGTTIESNRCCCDFTPKAPCTSQRYLTMKDIPYHKMVSIEPIMNFGLDILVDWIKQIAPEFVSIGADSKGHHLPEPPANKIKALIEALQEITEVKIKDNLKRILSNTGG